MTEKSNPFSDWDPYKLHHEHIQDPPKTVLQSIKHLGPALIITASIVGVGELIAAPTLGSQVGFAALWLIIVSCLVKVIIQGELGRYTISTGETTMRALNRIPGPRFKVSWPIWCWIIMILIVFLQIGAQIGGTSQALNLLFPKINPTIWSVIITLIGILILYRSRYKFIVRFLTIMIVIFSIFTIFCAVMIIWTPYEITAADIIEGFKFHIPKGGLVTAMAVFGIVGVGATELVMYPYWCLEKGYARYSGKSDNTEKWISRAKGWIRVMHIDILLSMVIYTLATIAFFILGASVLHQMGIVPKGFETVKILSNMYTSTIGTWAFIIFLCGAFFVLFSTFISATATHSRTFTDLFEMIGWIKINNYEERMKYVGGLCIVIPIICFIQYSFIGEPVIMIIIGGTAQCIMLPVIAFSTIYLRYKHTNKSILPSKKTDILLWICSAIILCFAVYNFIKRIIG
ncbi:Nramp family divalent metal transporter [candidate division KSB1 bacterium]